MTKILALIAGIFLIGFPAWMLREMSVPLPEYRKGGYADYVLLAYELLAVYGSVLLGIAVHVGRAKWSGQSLFPFGLFKAGMCGVLVAASAYFVAGGVYGLIRYGAFDKVIGGTLWGLLAIFWGVFGALVSAGLALLFYAWRGSAGYRPPGSAGLGTPRS
ncbi:MAG TPA: hypothetical protein VL198_08290 [Pseudolabrys sp.]|jgi:hypothetical protein|nr:hypothetical protein [Pseudolabrys sp.]